MNRSPAFLNPIGPISGGNAQKGSMGTHVTRQVNVGLAVFVEPGLVSA